ncbi:MAG TPA: cell envelope integrity protein CreD [Rhodanobacteraceae bacterium]|jgi:inner membrane protein|nr:cell envelope integrity protein CreD [Rhodanobacteraceae bacterium]
MVAQAFQGATFKVLGIGLLALLMLIPLSQVGGLVGEREGRAREATQHIAERWGAQQLLGAPVLVVPVKRQVMQDKVVTTVEEREYVLADRAAITGKLAPGLRRYGIYETAVYTADLTVEGHFAASDISALARSGTEPQWQRAELRVPIADVRGIRRISTIAVGEHDLSFGPGADGVAAIAAVSAPVALDPSTMKETLPFSFMLTLAGTERLAVLPLARKTDVNLSSPWPDPGFDGAFLPAARRIDANGFEAQWQVLDLNRRLAQHWRESESPGALAESSFGITLTQPAGSYQQNVRAVKYGVLFIALTFVAFFLFEVLRGLRVHTVQYLLVGLALCTFYVVLLALSEQIGFGFAYAIAATCVVTMIGGYAAVVLATRTAGVLLGAMLALVYSLLYGLVVSEDYALLMGSLALLAGIGGFMYLTRRVDWYALTPAPAR